MNGNGISIGGTTGSAPMGKRESTTSPKKAILVSAMMMGQCPPPVLMVRWNNGSLCVSIFSWKTKRLFFSLLPSWIPPLLRLFFSLLMEIQRNQDSVVQFVQWKSWFPFFFFFGFLETFSLPYWMFLIRSLQRSASLIKWHWLQCLQGMPCMGKGKKQ